MRSFFAVLLATLAGLVLWTTLIVKGTLDGWWREPLAPTGQSVAFAQAVTDAIDDSYQGNVAFTLIKNNRIVSQHFASVGNSIDDNTLFQVASMSKWITAYGVMVLAQDGKINLDEPVSTYLRRWQLPATQYDNDGVTVRRLLSHTAGLTDGLGYLGFKPDQQIQTIEEALTSPNATKGPGVKIEVGIEPGSELKYSGGGYLILQLLVEEVSGMSFSAYMQSAVFEPLGMTRSTYLRPNADELNVASSYNTDGTLGITYNFTAVAAAGLYTSSSDLARFISAHLNPRNFPGALSGVSLMEMRKPHGFNTGLAIWGLGAILFAETENGEYIFGHDGKNDPAINTSARINPVTGDGFILLETGNDLLATKLASQWTFWQAGTIDILTLESAIKDMIKLLLPGWIVIALAGIVIGWRKHRAQRV
ncbi:MAG: serine hydrolase domain-containing protein [Pseudomonadales bacterium]